MMNSSRTTEREQIQSRIRALENRANALSEELSRSSLGTRTALVEVQQTYEKIINEFNDERDEILRRIRQTRKNLQQSTNQLETVRKTLDTAQSGRSPDRKFLSKDENLNATLVETEEILQRIGRQLKKIRFANGRIPMKNRKTLKNLDENQLEEKQTELFQFESIVDFVERKKIFLMKSFVIELDVLPRWTIGTIDKRIFLCDTEGEVRIFSYHRPLQRQPLLAERFHLTTKRLITGFTITKDYLVAFELDTRSLTLHTHHGALLLRLPFPSDPLTMVRANFNEKNQIWVCNRNRKVFHQIQLEHRTKQTLLIEKIDFNSNVFSSTVDPIGISSDGTNRIAIHDVNSTNFDRLLISNSNDEKRRFESIDLVQYHENPFSSIIEQVLLVPNYPNLIILLSKADRNSTRHNEILLLDIENSSHVILGRVNEPNGIESIDVTLNGEFVYASRATKTDRVPSKMHIFALCR